MMIKIAREGFGEMDVFLMTYVMRQPTFGMCGWRQAKRSQIAQLFRSQSTGSLSKYMKNTRRSSLDAQFGNSSVWHPEVWVAVLYNTRSKVFPGQLQIGCVRFTVGETKVIRRWALAKH